MQVILVITDKKGKNLLFILDTLETLTLNDMIDCVKKQELQGFHLVKTKKCTFIRTNPNATPKDNLDFISIPLSSLTRTSKEESSAIKQYREKRKQHLDEKEKQKEKIIYIDGTPKRTETEVIAFLSRYKSEILSASKSLKVDNYLLGAILIDEELRRDWLDNWDSWLAKLGIDSSIGIAQVKISTARNLIKRGFYNPNPKDKNLLPQKINSVPNKYIQQYLDNPNHSIHFAGAKINQIIQDWSQYIDLKNKPEIIGSLYSLGRKPHANPEANDRGRQIAGEFYQIAKKALK